MQAWGFWRMVARKWKQFAIDIFKRISLNKIFILDSNFIEVCSWVPYWQQVSIGSDYGLEPNKEHEISWACDDLVYRCIDASLIPGQLVLI